MKPSSDYPFLYVRGMCNSGGSILFTLLTVTVLYPTSSIITKKNYDNKRRYLLIPTHRDREW